MSDASPTSSEAALEAATRAVQDSEHPFVKLALTDLDGVLRGKYVSRAKMLSALEKGFGFCDVILGWDSNDQLYPGLDLTGWHTGYPDAQVRVLPETMRTLPLEEGMLFFLCELDGRAEAVCPRGILRRVIDAAAAEGMHMTAGVEYEVFVFDETPASAKEKGYRDLVPFTPGNFGYSVLRSSVHAELYKDTFMLGAAMRMPIEGLHTETGPGVIEAALSPSAGVEAADRANLFKTFFKVLLQRAGLLGTFMAKHSDEQPGQSGHIHVSLSDASGTNLFYDANHPKGISDTMRWFIGGQQRLLPELLAMVAPTVNSYCRLVPGFWAPTSATWGVENRTCALRAIPGSAKSQRVEFRVAAADANPYLALAAALGAGLVGIREKLEPTAPIEGNAYAAEPDPELRFPSRLASAADRLLASKHARDLFGDTFVEHFATSRHWEERELARTVTDWELARYFEII